MQAQKPCRGNQNDWKLRCLISTCWDRCCKVGGGQNTSGVTKLQCLPPTKHGPDTGALHGQICPASSTFSQLATRRLVRSSPMHLPHSFYWGEGAWKFQLKSIARLCSGCIFRKLGLERPKCILHAFLHLVASTSARVESGSVWVCFLVFWGPGLITVSWQHVVKKSVTLVEVETSTFFVDPCRLHAWWQEAPRNHKIGDVPKTYTSSWRKTISPQTFFPRALNVFAGWAPCCDVKKFRIWSWHCDFWVGRPPIRIVFGQVFEACLRASLCGWRHGRRRILRSSRRSCCVGERLWRGVGESAVCFGWWVLWPFFANDIECSCIMTCPTIACITKWQTTIPT